MAVLDSTAISILFFGVGGAENAKVVQITGLDHHNVPAI